MGSGTSQLHEACQIGAWVDVIKMAEAIDAGKVQEVVGPAHTAPFAHRCFTIERFSASVRYHNHTTFPLGRVGKSATPRTQMVIFLPFLLVLYSCATPAAAVSQGVALPQA